MLKTGNLGAAAAIAEKAAPYCDSKVSSAELLRPLPEDLQPDPPPLADAEGPANPILWPKCQSSRCSWTATEY
jgi:hypothetical protein